MKTALSITALMLPSAQAGLFDMFKWETCPQTQPLTDFDIDRYLGEWYEMYKRKDSRLQDGECTLATYSSSEYPNFIRVENSISRVNPDGSFAKRNGVQGWGKEYNPGKRDGKLGVKFFWWLPYGGYTVLYTDYENVALVHNCESYGFWKSENQWVLTRKAWTGPQDGPEFDDITKSSAAFLENALPGFDFNDKMKLTTQGESNGCEYYSPFDN